MGKRRDEFTNEAKKKLGYRAGFRCCFPGCNQVLVGKADNKNGYIFNGEYAHITAAAYGGPRYDPSLTEEERKSYDNGILMCRNHATLIDMNEKEYPAELLKEWRDIAENKNYIELSNNKYFEKNEEEIEASFSALYEDGEYEELDKRIQKFNGPFGGEIHEIVLRYSILLGLFNGRDIKKEIEDYKNLKNKKIPLIINEFIIFNKQEYIKLILDSVDNDILKHIYSLTLSNSCLDLLSNKEFVAYFKKYEKSIDHLQLQILFRDEYLCFFKSKEGKIIEFCDDSFLYEFIINSITLKKKVVILEEVNQKELDEAYYFFVKNIYKINKMPDYYRLKGLELLLNYLATYQTDSYQSLYNDLKENDKSDLRIQASFYRYKINTKTITIRELEEIYVKTKDDDFLCFYLFNLPQNEAKDYLNNHMFLLKESSLFLLRYLVCIQERDRKDVFSRYKDSYPNDDFVSACLSWIYFDDKDKKEICYKLESVPKKGINVFNAIIYLHTLVCKKEYTHYFELVKLLIGVDAGVLLSAFELQKELGDNNSFNQELIELYERKIEEKFSFENLKYNLAILYYKEGKVKKAEDLLNEEFDEYNSINSLHSLLAIRIEQKEYVKDKRFESAKRFKDYGCQLYVAETLYQERDYETALIYYERAILCNNGDKAARVKIFEIMNNLKLPKIKEIKGEAAITLKNKNKETMVLFHKAEVIDDFSKKEENHYSVDDNIFNDFYLKQKGDLITYNKVEYKIINVENIYEYYGRSGLLVLINDPSTQKFDNTNINDAVKSIFEILQKNKKEKEKIVEEYLSFGKACPISISSKRIFGSRLFANLNFIYSKKNRKNIELYLPNNKKTDYSKIYFYYDALFVLFRLYNKKEFTIKDNWYIPNRIYLDIKTECQNELRDIENGVERLDIVNNTPTRILQDVEGRRTNRKWLLDFLSFISKFKVEKGSLYKIKELNSVFKEWEDDMKSECEMIDLINSNANSCITTDSIFIHYLCTVIEKNYLATFNLLKLFFDDEYILLMNEIINPLEK